MEKSKITDKGDIVNKFSNLTQKILNDKKERKVLILGSGYVVPPVVDFFENKRDGGIKITIGTSQPEEAAKLFENNQVDIVELNVLNDAKILNDLINKTDIVIR